MGFVEHLQEFVGREAKLEELQASVHGAHYKYLLEFAPGSARGESVTLREVWKDCILVEYVGSHVRKEIPVDRIQLGTLNSTAGPAAPAPEQKPTGWALVK
jgi:hypothetical protein